MVATNLGNYNPQPLEPYPVQTAIAGDMARQSPGLDLPLLNYYDQMHQVNQEAYNQQLGVQRDLAIRQLQAQMADNYIKAIGDASKNPGEAALLANSPFLSQVYGGASPDAVGGFIGATGGNIALGQTKTAGESAKAFADAGITPPVGMYNSILGTNLPPAGVSIPEKVADISGRYRVAAAQVGSSALREIDVPTGVLGLDHKPLVAKGIKYNIYDPPEVQQAAIKAQVETWLKSNNAMPTGGFQAIPSSPGQGPGTAPTGGPGATPMTGADPGPLLGGLGGDGQPTPVALGGINSSGQANPIPTGLAAAPQAPAGPDATGSTPPPAAQGAPAQTTASAGSPGQAKPPASPPVQVQGQIQTPANAKQPDTPPKGLELSTNKNNIALQARARQGLTRLNPADREEITILRAHFGGDVPIRRIGGIEYYIGKDGRLIAPVPTS